MPEASSEKNVTMANAEATTSGVEQKSSGNNGNNRNRGNRNRGGKNKNRNNNHKNDSGFKGKCADLAGHIFDCSKPGQADLYVTTKEEIEDYVGRSYKYGGDIKWSLENLEKYNIDEPEDLPDDHTNTQELIWKKRVEEYVKRDIALTENLKTVYSLVWGQCTDILKAKLEALTVYTKIKKDYDVIGLLKQIKTITYKFEEHNYIYLSLYNAWRNFYTFKQGKDDTNAQYLEKFTNMVDVLEQYGGRFGYDYASIAEQGYFALDKRDQTEDMFKIAVEQGKKKFLSYAFIAKADHDRYAKLKEELRNDFLKNTDNNNKIYPDTVTAAYNLLSNYRVVKTNTRTSTTTSGLAFVNAENNSTGNNGNNRGNSNKYKNAICRNCGKKGHLQWGCPEKNNNNNNNTNVTCLTIGDDCEPDTEFSFLQTTISLFQKDEEFMENLKWWILLDNQSTTDIFGNPKLVKNIRKSNNNTKILTNGGGMNTDLIADLTNYGSLWFHPQAIANIISMKNMCKKYRVTFDSENGNKFIVHKPDGTKVIFKMSKQGLYYHDTRDRDVILLNTVAENKAQFSNREIEGATKARELYGQVGYPSQADFINIVRYGMINDCKITVQDIKNALSIFGPDIFALKGKTVRQKPTQVVTEYYEIPSEIMERHRNITLVCDVMFVNGIIFFITVSRFIKFCTVENIADRSKDTLLKCFKHVVDYYNRRGFSVKFILMDPESSPMQQDVAHLGVTLNPASYKEHCGDIERMIRTIKERVRCGWNKLPYDPKPHLMIRELINFTVMWLNAFPPKEGISKTLSPRILVAGTKLSAKEHCRIEFGAYAQVHEEDTPRNSMLPRTIGAICLGPTGNIQGGYKFMSLSTGRLIVRRSFTIIPLTADVIQRVNDMGLKDEVNRKLKISTLSFGDITDDYDDDDITVKTNNQANKSELFTADMDRDLETDFLDDERELPSPMTGVDDDVIYDDTDD